MSPWGRLWIRPPTAHQPDGNWAWRRLVARFRAGDARSGVVLAAFVRWDADRVTLDALWALVCPPHPARSPLWDALRRMAVPAARPAVLHTLSRLALGDGYHYFNVNHSAYRAYVASAATHAAHPVGDIARARIAGEGDAALLEEVCAAGVPLDSLPGLDYRRVWTLIPPPDPVAHPRLWAAVLAHGEPEVRASTIWIELAFGTLPTPVTDPTDQEELARAAVDGHHPLVAAARDAILRSGGARLIDQVCARALADPVRDEPGLVWWCGQHGLAPTDPVRRAEFHLLTGDIDAWRATDPDGSLLASVYRDAHDEERTVLRELLAAVPDLDPVPVVVGGRPAEPASDAERRYVVELLTERGDWARLWQQTLLAPLTDGVALARQLDGVRRAGRWEPPTERDAGLLDRLAGADADALGRLIDRLADDRPRHLCTTDVYRDYGSSQDPDGPSLNVSLAPDYRRLVVRALDDAHREQSACHVERAIGGPPRRLPGSALFTDVLHLGDAVVVAGYDGLVRHRIDTEAPEVLLERSGHRYFRALRVPSGFVTESADGWLVFGSADRGLLHSVGLPIARDRRSSHLVATDPWTGRILIRGARGPSLRLLDAEGRTLARGGSKWQQPWHALFFGPDRLVTVDRTSRHVYGSHSVQECQLTSWQVVNEQLVATEEQTFRRWPDGVAALRHWSLVVIASSRDGWVFFDAATLQWRPSPFDRPLESQTIEQLWAESAGGIAWWSAHANSADIMTYFPVVPYVAQMARHGTGPPAERAFLDEAAEVVALRGEDAELLDLCALLRIRLDVGHPQSP